MFIEPNSLIRLISNCPLDNTYEHTLYWDSISAQTTYFESIAKHRLDKYSYQNYTSGVMKVNLPAEQLYDCNYLMFQNTSFGLKWFYAFVKSVEYINNVTTEIRYEMDVMQTWFFDYELGECFIDREHSATDSIGENTVPENLEKGPYIVTAQMQQLGGDLYVYLLATEPAANEGTGGADPPGLYGGFPQPCYVYRLNKASDFTSKTINTIINWYSEKGKNDSVIAIFTAPGNFVSTSSNVRTMEMIAAQRTLSYSPKNKKLYTYPYCVNVVEAAGQAVELQYELFSGTPRYQITGGFGANMVVSCRPLEYAGKQVDFENTITLTGWPQLAWVSNSYQNWLAQNANRLSFSQTMGYAKAAIGIGAMAGGGFAGNVPAMLAGGRAAISGFEEVTSIMALKNDMKVIPDQMHGSAEAAPIDAVSGVLGFYSYCKSIRPEYVKMIDDYFSRFGYATHRIKVPNRNVRPHWCFTKTVACTLLGSLPADVSTKIAALYDAGITFWKNPAEVGNYSLDNSV